ncbi:MAG: hypothetical protein ACREJG_07345 [Candidatus Rokuibacteriota bacterium]
MTDAELWAAWRLWMAVAAVIVLVAAALLVTIWLTARSIVAHATRALRAAEAIRAHTLPIWRLQSSNEGAAQILEVVRGIEAKAATLAEALQSQAAPGGR